METTPVMRNVEDVSESQVRQAHTDDVQQAARVSGLRPEAARQVDKADEAKGVKPFSEEELEDIAEKMNQVSHLFNATLNFSVDKPTGKTVIKVMDQETDEMIRQIPPENLLKLMTNMRDVMGMLLDVEI